MLEVGAFQPAWSNIHLGPANALKAHALLGGGPLLPIHWGTFNLALHPWDEPIETLLRLAPATSARVLTPKLGEPIEPSHDRKFETWWRGLDTRATRPAPEPETQLPKEMPWPID
jgi:L-ascorbate metabolism protein UlaG (beta-lactamase superfamily)